MLGMLRWLADRLAPACNAVAVPWADTVTHQGECYAAACLQPPSQPQCRPQRSVLDTPLPHPLNCRSLSCCAWLQGLGWYVSPSDQVVYVTSLVSPGSGTRPPSYRPVSSYLGVLVLQPTPKTMQSDVNPSISQSSVYH